MTLSKQIGAVTALFLTFVLVTILVLNFHSSQQFIQNQLYSNAEDTAASLALSLGSAVNEADPLTTMQTMISAIFDRGYYESIRLLDAGEKLLFERHAPIVVKDVPQWFISLVELKAPYASSEVAKGWESFGTLQVKSHVGHGYVQLWDIFVELLQTFALLAALFLLLLALLIKIILKPLSRVENQAKAISNHEFFTQDKIPFTTEFRHVVTAMNSMVVKVKEIFEREAKALQQYQELLYTDPLSRLHNRKYLQMRLSSLLNEQSAYASGSFALLSFNDLLQTKERLGFKRYEALLQAFAELLKQPVSDIEESAAVRMNDNDFALLMPEESIERALPRLNLFLTQSKELLQRYDLQEELHLSIGLVAYSHDDTIKNLFAKADFHLAKAKMHPSDAIDAADPSREHTLFLGKEEWISMLDNSLEENMLKLASQRVVASASTDQILHRELFLRLLDGNGTVYSAGYFLPMLINLKLTDKLDRFVVTSALQLLKKDPTCQAIGINISADFIKEPVQHQWLLQQLDTLNETQRRSVSFEASNFAVIRYLELFDTFSQELHRRQVRFGIDNFSFGEETLHYLQQIKPHYIKADKSLFYDLKEGDQKSAGESFAILTKSVGIELIATNIERQEDIDNLQGLGVSYLQGSYIEEPKILGAD